jgi:hypothetical protein
MDQELYDYSPITERPPLRWPEGRTVAFHLVMNIEHFRLDLPATSTTGVTVGLVPDALNYGWRDYGVRVGIGILLRAFKLARRRSYGSLLDLKVLPPTTS